MLMDYVGIIVGAIWLFLLIGLSGSNVLLFGFGRFVGSGRFWGAVSLDGVLWLRVAEIFGAI